VKKILIIGIMLSLCAILFASEEGEENLGPILDNEIDVEIYPDASWEALVNMPIGKCGCYIGYQTSVADEANYIHVFGGNPAPGTEHMVYDITAGTWSTAASTLPAQKRYGATVTSGNFIYLIAGYGDKTIVIWDIAGDSCWVSPAITTLDNRLCAVLVGDLIYIAGGGNGGWTPGANVEVYDISGDSIYAATSMPGARLGGAFGYIGNDTLIYACGHDGGTYHSNTYMGYINPADPADITWITGDALPGTGRRSVGYGSACDTVLFMAAGQFGSTYTNEAWAYFRNSGWVALPDKPSPVPFMNVNSVAVPSAGNEIWFYCSGGYESGTYYPTFDRYLSDIINYIEENPGGEISNNFNYNLLTPITSDIAKIQFNLPVSGSVVFTVYDFSGREVRMDYYSSIGSGSHTMNWGLNDNNNEQVSAGSYFFRLEAAGNVATGKFVVTR